MESEYWKKRREREVRDANHFVEDDVMVRNGIETKQSSKGEEKKQ